MKNWRLHIWFIINAGLLLIVYLYPVLFKTPVVIIVFILSGFILKTKKEIKEEYTARIPWYGVLLGLLLPAALVVSAFTGYTKYLNSLVTIENTRIGVLILAGLVLIGYISLNFSGLKKNKA